MSPGGRIKQSDIDTVRERTDIVQLISEYVPLKKSGRQFRGPCPFHKEKDPSFYVDPSKSVFHCFGCKVGGNSFDFVMKAEGLGFADAVERLADRIGLQLSYEASTEAEVKGRLEKDRLFKLNQTACGVLPLRAQGDRGREDRYGVSFGPGFRKRDSRRVQARVRSPGVGEPLGVPGQERIRREGHRDRGARPRALRGTLAEAGASTTYSATAWFSRYSTIAGAW